MFFSVFTPHNTTNLDGEIKRKNLKNPVQTTTALNSLCTSLEMTSLNIQCEF